MDTELIGKGEVVNLGRVEREGEYDQNMLHAILKE